MIKCVSLLKAKFKGTKLHSRFRDNLCPDFKKLLSTHMVRGYELYSQFPPERTLICAIALQGFNIGAYYTDYCYSIIVKDLYTKPEKV